MTLYAAKIITVARIHAGGMNAGDNKAITLEWPGGSASSHLAVAFKRFRGAFSDVDVAEADITIDIPGMGPPTDAQSYARAQTHVHETLPQVFDIAPHSVYTAGHAWRDGRWVPIQAGEFGYGYLVTKKDERGAYVPHIESVSWGPYASPTLLVLDFVVAIFSP